MSTDRKTASGTGRPSPGAGKADPGFILDNLDAYVWFADRSKVLRYMNRPARLNRSDVSEAMGRNVEECHKKPESVADIRKMYAEWEKGGREVKVYCRDTSSGRKYNILVPVHGDNGFEGVVELSFTETTDEGRS